MTVNWEEVTAITGIGAILLTVFGTFATLYISDIVSSKIDSKFLYHTEHVLMPLMKKIDDNSTDISSLDKRISIAEVRLNISKGHY